MVELWVVGLLAVGCDGQGPAENRYFDSYGSGSTSYGGSSSSSGGNDGGGADSVPDAGDGGWEPTPDAGGSGEEEEEVADGCFIEGAATSQTIDLHQVGEYWDQGNSELCALVAWVNGNIAAGANVPEGADLIIVALMTCMGEKGHSIVQIGRDGMTPGQAADLRACKEEEMEERGLPVSISYYSFLNDGGEAKLLCEEIHDVLHPDNAVERQGAAVVAIGHHVWPDNMVDLPQFVGHQVQIVDTECIGVTMRITLRDPNYPAVTFTLTVDCYNMVIDTGGHPRFKVGDQVSSIGIETPG